MLPQPNIESHWQPNEIHLPLFSWKCPEIQGTALIKQQSLAENGGEIMNNQSATEKG